MTFEHIPFELIQLFKFNQPHDFPEDLKNEVSLQVASGGGELQVIDSGDYEFNFIYNAQTGALKRLHIINAPGFGTPYFTVLFNDECWGGTISGVDTTASPFKPYVDKFEFYYNIKPDSHVDSRCIFPESLGLIVDGENYEYYVRYGATHPTNQDKVYMSKKFDITKSPFPL